jgi:hypothetical protein
MATSVRHFAPDSGVETTQARGGNPNGRRSPRSSRRTTHVEVQVVEAGGLGAAHVVELVVDEQGLSETRPQSS